LRFYGPATGRTQWAEAAVHRKAAPATDTGSRRPIQEGGRGGEASDEAGGESDEGSDEGESGGGGKSGRCGWCGAVCGALATVGAKVAATLGAGKGDPLVPLRHTARVEGLAFYSWCSLGMWGPL
jgi:hypothetical protein